MDRTDLVALYYSRFRAKVETWTAEHPTEALDVETQVKLAHGVPLGYRLRRLHEMPAPWRDILRDEYREAVRVRNEWPSAASWVAAKSAKRVTA